MTRVEIPGKLFISGEYAVLHGAHAVLSPVKRSMVFDIVPGEEDRFASGMHGVVPLEGPPRLPHDILGPYRIALSYLAMRGIRRKPFLLTVRSKLALRTMKLGLGSSGALTVGIIRSILAFHGLRPPAMTLYKLSVLSKGDEGSLASFGDIAVAAFGRWILYRMPDFTWVRSHRDQSLSMLLQTPWPGLLVRPFTPSGVWALAVNTMRPSSSKALVKSFEGSFDPVPGGGFIRSMDRLSLILHDTLTSGRDASLTIREANRMLERIARRLKLPLFPKDVKRALDALSTIGATPKLSGAGGGDCVLGFFSHEKDYRKALFRLDRGMHPVIHLTEVDP